MALTNAQAYFIVTRKKGFIAVTPRNLKMVVWLLEDPRWHFGNAHPCEVKLSEPLSEVNL